MSLACPAGTIMSRRLADDNVRSCDLQSESAAQKAISFSGGGAMPPGSLR
jgi:hypothetical protein